MTNAEHIHTLLEEDKDALVSSYLSLLAFVKTHERLSNNDEEKLNEIYQSVHKHIGKLPEDSVVIFEELSNNEMKRLMDDD